MTDNDFVDRVDRKPQAMLADQFDAQPLDTKFALPAECQDELFLLREDAAMG